MLLLSMLTACGPERVASWCGDDVVGARLTEANLVHFAILGGSLQGQGLLVADRTGGDECYSPVTLAGGMVGLAIDVTDVLFLAELELPTGGVEGAALFGRYDGSAAAAVAPVGVATKHLVNGYGVEIDQANFALGIGIGVSYAWLDIEIDAGTAYDTADSAYDRAGTGGDSGGDE